MKEMVKFEGEKKKTFIVRVVKHGIAETSTPQTPGNPVNTANSPQTSIWHSDKQAETYAPNTYITYFFLWRNCPDE